MKKIILLSIAIMSSIFATSADSFTDIIQDLAIQTACIGKYSATQAGGGWYDDPYDYYTPDMMAERFKKMSGNMTRTTTFYGVCFDYAEFAYQDIKSYELYYNQNGMYEKQYFLAGVDSNPNTITLSSPTNRDGATSVQNGVYVKTYGSSSYRNVKTHKMTSGTRATHHSWLWIQRNDGVWFWIDPTWTDNLGYVVYGYVSNGEEIQLRPDEKYCINYPNYLRDLPLPPKWGKRLAPSTSNTTTGRSNTTSSSSSANYSNTSSGTSSSNKTLGLLYVCAGYTGSFSKDKSATSSNQDSLILDGTAFSIDTYANKGEQFAIFSVDLFFRNGTSYLFGFDWGYGLTEFFQPYCGGALGFSDNTGFSWKINAGIRIPISAFCIRADISYSDVLGFAGTVAIGMDLAFL